MIPTFRERIKSFWRPEGLSSHELFAQGLLSPGVRLDYVLKSVLARAINREEMQIVSHRAFRAVACIVRCNTDEEFNAIQKTLTDAVRAYVKQNP